MVAGTGKLLWPIGSFGASSSKCMPPTSIIRAPIWIMRRSFSIIRAPEGRLRDCRLPSPPVPTGSQGAGVRNAADFGGIRFPRKHFHNQSGNLQNARFNSQNAAGNWPNACRNLGWKARNSKVEARISHIRGRIMHTPPGNLEREALAMNGQSGSIPRLASTIVVPAPV